MQPSAEYQAHHEGVMPPQVDARTFRQGWQVRTRLDVLLADGLIQQEHWATARAYRAAWERVLALPGMSVASGGGRGLGGPGDAHSRLWPLVRVLGILRRVERDLGPRTVLVCRLCVVEDRSWRSIGDQLGTDHHTAKRLAARAVTALGTWTEGPRVAPSRSLVVR